MTRYIDADTLYVKVKAECNPYGKPTISFDDGCKVLDMIRRTSTADVVPVVHAHWIYRGAVDDYHDSYTCSNCLCVEILTTRSKVSYCWNCGAKMDEVI